MVTPLAPVPNAVAFQNRVSLILNRAGTDLQNPVCGTNRYLVGETADPAGGGFNIRVSFALMDAAEVVTAATVRSYDENGDFVESVSFKGSISHNTTSLVATADLVAGVDFPTASAGRRNEIVVQTNANRTLKQQIHCRDKPTDIVTVNGQVTTELEPLDIQMEEIDVLGNFTASFRVAFFSSWNDEVARQHGAEGVNLNGAIEKPYGGARTVEVFSEFGGDDFGNLVEAEADCEETTTLTWAPTSDGETVHLSFKFRSLRGSDEFVLGEAWVRFFECEEGAPASTTCVIPPCEEYPIITTPPTFPDIPEIPDDDVGTFDPDDGEVVVGVGGLGNSGSGGTDFATGLLRLAGFAGGVESVGGVATPFVVPLGEQTYALTDSDVGTDVTVTLDTDLADASLIVVSIESEGGGTGTLRGNSLVYVSDHTDIVDLPEPPTIEQSSPAPSFSFSTRQLTFTVNDFGWPDEDLSVRARPLYGEIRNISAQAQTYDDVSVGSATVDTETVLYSSGTGSKTLTFSWSNNDIQGVVFTFYNSFGATTYEFYTDRGFTDSGEVKKGPSISSVALDGTALDEVSFNLDDDGGAVGSLTPFYIIVDSAGSQVQVTGSASITVGSGARTFKLNTGHDDIDGHYYVGLFNEQGGLASSNLSHINNLGGSNTLGS